MVAKTYKYPHITKAAVAGEKSTKALAEGLVLDEPKRDGKSLTGTDLKDFYEDVSAELMKEGVAYAPETLAKFRKTAIWVKGDSDGFPWVEGVGYYVHEAGKLNTSDKLKTYTQFTAWVTTATTVKEAREFGKTTTTTGSSTYYARTQAAIKPVLNALKKVTDSDVRETDMDEVAAMLEDVTAALHEHDITGALNPEIRFSNALVMANVQLTTATRQAMDENAPAEAGNNLGAAMMTAQNLLAKAQAHPDATVAVTNAVNNARVALGIADMLVRRNLVQTEQDEVPATSLSASTTHRRGPSPKPGEGPSAIRRQITWSNSIIPGQMPQPRPTCNAPDQSMAFFSTAG